MKRLAITDNARNMSPESTLEAFVVNDSFLELTSPHNYVVLGSRGSGKTQLLRMLSFDLMRHLERGENSGLPDTTELIGVYIAFNAFWAGDISDKSWRSETDYQNVFSWRLNVSTSIAFLDCVDSLIEELIEDPFDRIAKSSELSKEINMEWFFAENSNDIETLNDLRNKLERYDLRRKAQERRLLALCKPSAEHSMPDSIFDCEILEPILKGRSILEGHFGAIRNSNWAICLDEADFISESLQKLINTRMRSHPERLFIKMSTVPFGHYTNETETEEVLDVGHDIKYLYIDKDASKEVETNARKAFTLDLLKKHFGSKVEGLNDLSDLDDIFGSSVFLNTRSRGMDEERFVSLLERFANESTIARARKDLNKDSIVRKMRGTLFLKEQREINVGNANPSAYYGTDVFLRCTDANPRRMLELFKNMIEARGAEKKWPLANKLQNKTYIGYAKRLLDRSRAEERCGMGLHSLLSDLLSFFDSRFDGKISTDYYYSFVLKENDPDSVKALVKKAVELGLIYPNNQKRKPDAFPYAGKAHLAFALAPAYYLLPRKGSAVNLMTALRDASVHAEANVLKAQNSLFDEAVGQHE